MDRTQYWFLDAVVTYRLPISVLSASNLDEILNHPGHGLTDQEVVIVLSDLFRAGYLVASPVVNGQLQEDEYVPEPDEIARYLRGPHTNRYAVYDEQDAYWGLTAEGGMLWEAHSSPDWSRYVSDSAGLDDSEFPWDAEVICTRLDLLERYLALDQSDPWTVLAPDSMKWDMVEPWEATYWKTLVSAHRLRYRYARRTFLDDPRDIVADREHRAAWSAFLAITQWYAHPFR